MTECSECGGWVSSSSYICVHCGAPAEAMFAKQRAAMEEKWKPAKPGCWDFLVIYPLEAVFNTIVTGLFPLIGLYLAVVIGLHAAGFSDVPVGLITFFAMAVPFYVVFFSLKIALWLLSLVWK